MATIPAATAAHPDVVYFFYGLAFLLAGPLWLLGWFGLAHSVHEFTAMWQFIKHVQLPLQGPFEWACLVGSYGFLLEAGKGA